MLIIALLVLIFLAIIAPGFLKALFAIPILIGTAIVMSNGSHPSLDVAVGILIVFYLISGATSKT